MAQPSSQDLQARIYPISEQQSSICSIAVSVADLSKLSAGFRAQDMDDRWNVYFSQSAGGAGRGTVSLVRSWTGYEDLRGDFRLVNTADAAAVFDQIHSETNTERRGPRDQDAKDEFVRLLNVLLDTNLDTTRGVAAES